LAVEKEDEGRNERKRKGNGKQRTWERQWRAGGLSGQMRAMALLRWLLLGP
jgi:hypothetical protein